MNQDEAWIGKVMAAGLIGLTLWGITALLQAQGEGARRARLVIGGAIALGVAAMLFALGGPVIFAIEMVIFGATIWVVKGFKKNGSTTANRGVTPPSQSNETEKDATEFSDVNDAPHHRKTVITCPNCAGRLRVQAGKYIDVTCPHCRVVFRTKT